MKGVGDYTAAAICSFAYGLPCAVVDGNVYRVLSRYFGLSTPIDTSQGKKEFAALAAELLPARQSADYNQGLMDFGSLQCLPAAPRCTDCPLSDSCQAWATKTIEQLPVKSHRPKTTERFLIYIGVQTPQGIWLHRRGPGDIWQGLYELPLIESPHALTQQEVLRHEWVSRWLPPGGTWRMVTQRCKHLLTHRTLWADCYWLTYSHDVPVPPDYKVVPLANVSRYAMPRLLLRLMNHL